MFYVYLCLLFDVSPFPIPEHHIPHWSHPLHTTSPSLYTISQMAIIHPPFPVNTVRHRIYTQTMLMPQALHLASHCGSCPIDASIPSTMPMWRSPFRCRRFAKNLRRAITRTLRKCLRICIRCWTTPRKLFRPPTRPTRTHLRCRKSSIRSWSAKIRFVTDSYTIYWILNRKFVDQDDSDLEDDLPLAGTPLNSNKNKRRPPRLLTSSSLNSPNPFSAGPASPSLTPNVGNSPKSRFPNNPILKKKLLGLQKFLCEYTVSVCQYT